jgi:hypothetical protein
MIVIVTRYAEMSYSMPRYLDDLALAAEVREYLDEAVQEDIAGHEKKEKKQHRRKEAARKMPDPSE